MSGLIYNRIHRISVSFSEVDYRLLIKMMAEDFPSGKPYDGKCGYVRRLVLAEARRRGMSRKPIIAELEQLP